MPVMGSDVGRHQACSFFSTCEGRISTQLVQRTQEARLPKFCSCVCRGRVAEKEALRQATQVDQDSA